MGLMSASLFWLGRFMRVRLVGWGFIALLAIIAYFSARLALDTQYKAPRASKAVGQKHAPDFSAKQFTLWRSSLDGATQYQLTGESIIHYRDDLSSVVVKPHIIAKTTMANAKPNQHRQLQTTVTANDGLIRNDGELVQLTHAVNIVRNVAGMPASTLQSDSFVIAPDADWVSTRSPVTLTQGKNQTTALGGLEYHHADAQFQLSGRVHSIIAPK
jgi:lipopolysaccharide export system protein LptC